MSQRTRRALASFGLRDLDHRSHQLDTDDVEWADVVVVFEPSHLLYIRRHHPNAAAKTVALRRLVVLLAQGPQTRSVEEIMETAQLATIDVGPGDETIDPAGGDQNTFNQSALEINELITRLAEVLESPSAGPSFDNESHRD